MNQILSVENKKNKKNGPADIRKIIKFFCITILVFGLVIVGQGSYAIVKNIESNKTSVSKQDDLPTVNIDREGNNILIRVSHDKEISKMIYNWNNGQEQVVEGNGKNSLEKTIELPIGNNTFNLKVIDILGKEVSYKKDYVTDATRPQISIEVKDNKIKITAKDNVQLSHITYRWDEEEEKEVYPTEQSLAQIEQEIEIPRGDHKLTVVAVNSNNVTETKTQEVKGVTKPKVSVVQDGKYLVITATDEEAMKEIDYTLNGKPYKIDYSSVREKVIEYRQEMTPGENKIILTAYNINGAEEHFEGICTYNP